MRQVIIAVNCDSCRVNFKEREEGSNSVKFTVRSDQWEMDLCDECLGGGIFQEARPVKSKRKVEKDFTCDCGRSFGTQRGLSRHQTMTHG